MPAVTKSRSLTSLGGCSAISRPNSHGHRTPKVRLLTAHLEFRVQQPYSRRPLSTVADHDPRTVIRVPREDRTLAPSLGSRALVEADRRGRSDVEALGAAGHLDAY